MLQLANDELRVDVLDPVGDAARLGPRFCAGGYIWQVHDHVAGPLLTGPEWPNPEPDPFNGQGLPESFRHRTLEGRPLTWQGKFGVALGAGELEQVGPDQIRLAQPCVWQVVVRSDRLEFHTEQAFGELHYALSRSVALRGRQLDSITRLTNRSSREPLVLEWFAHPFFALATGNRRAEVNPASTLAENRGFDLTAGVLSQKRVFTGASDGHVERSLKLSGQEPLRASVPHPTLGSVRFETSFAPDFFVIWGNDRTFSLEPYLRLCLGPRESREWQLCYGFGAKAEP